MAAGFFSSPIGPSPATPRGPPASPTTSGTPTVRQTAPGATRTTWTPSSTIPTATRSEEHTSELQSRSDLVCRLLLEKKKKKKECDRNATKNEKQELNNAQHGHMIAKTNNHRQ